MFKLILVIIVGGSNTMSPVAVSQHEYKFTTLENCQIARQFYVAGSNDYVKATAACFKE